jgi:hypothetical protein
MSRQTDRRRVPRRSKHHASNGVLAAFASRLRGDSTRSSVSPLIRDPFAASGCTKMSADFTCPERDEIGHFADSQADVGKLVAENYCQTANNEAPRGKRDRGRDRKPVSSRLALQPNTARPRRSCQSPRAGVRRQQALAPVNEDFVPVIGVVHHQTSLGVFLEVAQRRVFIPANCTTTPSQVFEVGEPVTIWVLRRFAEPERLIP